MEQSRWDLTTQERNRARLRRDAAGTAFLMPMHRLQEEKSGKMLLTAKETLHVIWGVEDAVLDYMPGSLFDFERRLLPDARKHGRIWHGCVLLWSALCRLYVCDPRAARRHVEAGEEAGLVGAVPELQLAKGMALRLEGDATAAVAALGPPSRRDSPLFPAQHSMACAWLLEARVAGGIGGATPQQIKWLEREDKHVYHGTVGIILAALHRLGLSLEQRPEGVRTPAETLNALDQVAAFERPMLTMLLEDILPRPLAGVEPARQSAEAYWA